MTEKTATSIDAELKAWSQQQYTVGSCLFCPSYGITGPTEQVRMEMAEHRAQMHPELADRRRPRRRSVPGMIVFNGSLTDAEKEDVELERLRRMKLLGIQK